jgi:hypothetical protein
MHFEVRAGRCDTSPRHVSTLKLLLITSHLATKPGSPVAWHTLNNAAALPAAATAQLAQQLPQGSSVAVITAAAAAAADKTILCRAISRISACMQSSQISKAISSCNNTDASC